MSNAAVLLCAGKSTRMQGEVQDKILVPLAGRPAICYSIQAFVDSQAIEHLAFVYRDDIQKARIEEALQQCQTQNIEISWTLGGGERQDSVFNALASLSLLIEYVFIHDCARPLITPEIIRNIQQAVYEDKAAVLAHRISDTIKKSSSTKRTLSKRALKDVPRSGLWAMETPQAFERELITDAYRRLRFNNMRVTDDTAAASHQGHPITLVENFSANPKLTIPSDLDYVEYLLSKQQIKPAETPES